MQPTLPPNAQNLIDNVVRSHQGIETAKRRRQRDIQIALSAGVPATALASVLGISRHRIYQIRDGL